MRPGFWMGVFSGIGFLSAIEHAVRGNAWFALLGAFSAACCVVSGPNLEASP